MFLKTDDCDSLSHKTNIDKKSMTDIIISEIFGPTLQGEGHLIGVQTLFVRTGGCDFRCAWCDTEYAVAPKYNHHWKKMASSEVLKQLVLLSKHSPMWVTLSGGNPALQDFSELIKIGQCEGYRFCLETQGSVSSDWFGQLDHLVLSPKPPSSNMPFDENQFKACLNRLGKEKISIKIVIADQNDLDWAFNLAKKYTEYAFYLQPCHPLRTFDEQANSAEMLNSNQQWTHQQALDSVVNLHNMVSAMNWSEARILPQLHYLLWGGERGH